MTIEPITLEDPRTLEPTVAGTKAAGLARLLAAGFDVPGGVVLPVGVAAEWSDPTPPVWVRAGVERACATVGERLAVRSSTTWEDGEASAHAGASATELDVGGVDAVLAAVRRCLDASAQAQHDLGTGGDIAILLQRLVPADRAGVAFTADPVSGERDVVRIASTEGLGEALVQGEVIGGDVTVKGDVIDGDRGTLPAEDALAVAKVARDIETVYSSPVDVEWAVVDGHVHVLQARPITVLPVEPPLPEGNNWQKDVAHYPEPLTPFGWGLMHACEDQIRSVFDEMGLLIRGLEEQFVGGEVYGRVLPAFGSADAAGKPPPALIMGLAARMVPELRRRTAAARQVLEDDTMSRWLDEWHNEDRDHMIQRSADLADVDLDALDDADLAGHGDDCLALVRRGIRIHFQLVMPLAQSLYRLHRIVGDALGWDDAQTAGMLAGHSPATRAAEEAMTRLRRTVAESPAALAALEDDPNDPVGGLRRADPSLADELESWIGEHAWGLMNYDAGVPVLAERPTIVTRLILTDPDPADFGGADRLDDEARQALPADHGADFDEALAAARAVYPVREDNTLVLDRPMGLLRRWMLEVGDRLVARGILSHLDQAPYLFMDELRSALTGESTEVQDLVRRRRGEEAWVRANPGPLYVGDQGEPPDISRLPEPLRRVNEPILWFVSHEYPTPVDLPDDDDVLLAGVAASPGVAVGPVRIIRSHNDLDRLQDGDVLVCQVTSPAWAPLFPLAAAVVADGGGVLSHAAIASREHALPAVLGTGDGTSALRDGQLVRVDGTRGLVLAVD